MSGISDDQYDGGLSDMRGRRSPAIAQRPLNLTAEDVEIIRKAGDPASPEGKYTRAPHDLPEMPARARAAMFATTPPAGNGT